MNFLESRSHGDLDSKGFLNRLKIGFDQRFRYFEINSVTELHMQNYNAYFYEHVLPWVSQRNLCLRQGCLPLHHHMV